MNIKDKAKEYAEGKAINALTTAIEAAFTEGYNAGFNDGVASKEGEKPEDLEYNVEYVDLKLPSGTKWAKGYLRENSGNMLYLPFEKAQTMNIPTKQQYEELLKYCDIKPIVNGNRIDGCSIIATNGNTIIYGTDGYYAGHIYNNCQLPQFWLMEGERERNKRATANLGSNAYESFFMGYRFPVILVKE